MNAQGDVLNERCLVLEAENDELRERVRHLEAMLLPSFDGMPFGGLTASEARVLSAIAASPEGITKDRIFAAVYGSSTDADQPEPKIIDVYVCRLRKKLAPHEITIETVWGWGYRIDATGRARLREMRRAAA